MTTVISNYYSRIRSYQATIGELEDKWIEFAREKCITATVDIEKFVFIVTYNGSLSGVPITEFNVYQGYVVSIDAESGEEDEGDDEDEYVRIIEAKRGTQGYPISTFSPEAAYAEGMIIDIIKIGDVFKNALPKNTPTSLKYLIMSYYGDSYNAEELFR